MTTGPIRQWTEFLRRWFSAIFSIDVWNIGIVEVDFETLLAGGSFTSVIWSPNNRLFVSAADPFIWRQDGMPRVIYEHLQHFSGRGHICSVPLEGIASGVTPRVEICAPHHLSYPSTVVDGNQTWCIPEAADSGRVVLYAWLPAARVWQRSTAILEHPLLDPTVVRKDHRWYLFGVAPNESSNSLLRLFLAESLTGPWSEHPISPIKIQTGAARSAGAFFEYHGSLYRPSQANHKGYGCELRINRVMHLTPDSYLEIEQARVVPDRDSTYPSGLHTLALFGKYAVVDGKRRQWHGLAWLAKLLWAVRCQHFN